MEGEEKNLGECEKTNFFRELGCEEKGKGERGEKECMGQILMRMVERMKRAL